MDKHSFFQAAMKQLISQCTAHDTKWQLRKRATSTWMILCFLIMLINESGVRQGFAEFDFKKKFT